MPRQYTAKDAERAVDQLLTDQGLDKGPLYTWPLDEWVKEGSNRFVHEDDYSVEFDDDFNARVSITGYATGKVRISEVE
jgi:hypothetical protein